jgi:alpha-glucosidase
MHFGCKVTPDGLELSIGAHQGPYPAWWKQIHAEIFGWTPKQNRVLVNGQTTPQEMNELPHGIVVNVADDGKGMELKLQ